MESISTQTIVVGIDGSANSDAALDWAVAEASARGVPLHVFSAGVHHGEGPKAIYDDAVVDALIARESLADADQRLTVARSSILETAPGLAVSIESGLDRAADSLVALSRRAQVVVVGSSDHGPVVNAVLGSVASTLVTHAECPVVVVRTSPVAGPARSGVVVGVDGSALSELALAYAFEQASLKGVGLHVVHAWWTRATAGQTPDTQRDKIAQEKLTLSEAMVGWAEQYPDVEVRVSMPVGPAVLALTEAARGAELLVVGSRGLDGIRRFVLGSVSRGVLKHAPCTVVVVHERVVHAAALRTTGLHPRRAAG